MSRRRQVGKTNESGLKDWTWKEANPVGASRVSIAGGRVRPASPLLIRPRWVHQFLALGLSLGASVSTQAQARPPVQINTNVQLVQVPVIVFDDKGGVASDLKKDDFRLFEDGVEQRILYCERERESVSFVILDDLSSSMTRKIPFVQEATLSVLDSDEQQERYRDEFSVYGIASRAKNLVPFTRDQKDLERRLPWLLTPTNGSTALFDGIYLGISEAREQAANKRRAMIIISDGGDRNRESKRRRRFRVRLRLPKTSSARQNGAGRTTFRPSQKQQAVAFLRPSTRRIFRELCGPSVTRHDAALTAFRVRAYVWKLAEACGSRIHHSTREGPNRRL